METRPGRPQDADLARSGDGPARRRLGSVADGEETEAHDERPGSFAKGLGTSRATVSGRSSTWPPAAGTGLNEWLGDPLTATHPVTP
jgi:hypothetical protein